jgi:ribosomal protein S18 acetylase RimI-like enzyme
MPKVSEVGVRLRPASDADASTIVSVDRAAFTPHWWYGKGTVRRRTVEASHFAVAEVAGEVVGYVDGGLRLPTAHLNRIAVHPSHQGHGIGALLLHDALRAFWECKAKQITLNTQADNRCSRRLYGRFGFEPTGEFATAWELQL